MDSSDIPEPGTRSPSPTELNYDGAEALNRACMCVSIHMYIYIYIRNPKVYTHIRICSCIMVSSLFMHQVFRDFMVSMERLLRGLGLTTVFTM